MIHSPNSNESETKKKSDSDAKMFEMQLASTTSDEADLFTPVFKHFRRLPDVDCFKEAFSPENHPSQFQRCARNDLPIDLDPSLGLQPISSWSLYECRFSPGLYLLRNPFTIDGQRQWIDRSVNCYARQNRTSVGDNSENQHLARIRWATLGYHYDWTNKVYNRDDCTAVPNELKQLCHTVMKFISSNTGCPMMKAEAVIVNYYHLNSTLCAHTDHSEFDCLTQPLLSLSFGNAAIFLIGGEQKSSRSPSAILLRSGDILLMSGESRQCFHSVPRILLDPSSLNEVIDANRSNISFNYIGEKRININVRQVYVSLEESINENEISTDKHL